MRAAESSRRSSAARGRSVPFTEAIIAALGLHSAIPCSRPGYEWREAIAFATGAPSGHNTQPWLFRPRGDGLDLLADRTRRLPVVDPDDRELVISCGAALEYLRIAMLHAGCVPRIERLPDPAESDLLAHIAPGEAATESRQIGAWYAAAPVRRTNRRRYRPQPLPASLVSMLIDASTSDETRVHPVATPAAKHAVADLIAEGDRRQGADPSFRRELSAWLHCNFSRARDGIPASAFGVPGALSLGFPRLIRTFDWGTRQGAQDHALALEAPLLLLLATSGDARSDWLAAGQALARLLLQATVAGLSASFLNQPIEVPALRPQLAGVLDVAGHPQLLLRIGYGPPVAPTPRRAVDDVLIAFMPTR